MAAQTITYRGSRDDLRQLIRDIPAMIAGSKPDSFGLRQGVAARMAFTFFALVGRAFDIKSKGGTGDDGIQWAPNSRGYLAYQKGRTRSKARSGERNKGSYRVNRERHLTAAQKRVWTKANNAAIDDIIRELADAGMTATQRTIKAKAAVRAWAATREEGATSLIKFYPSRPDTILVDEGDMRRSIQPGTLQQTGAVDNQYQPPDETQLFSVDTIDIVVGSRDPKAAFHQNAKKIVHGQQSEEGGTMKGPVRRQMWPDKLPDTWVREIVGQVVQLMNGLPAALTRGKS